MLLGYNTNGFPHHDLASAIRLLAHIGYRSVAITLDHHALDPYSGNLTAETQVIRELLQRYGLRSVVETGARFLLDPEHKHEPTLVASAADGRARRVDFLRRAIDVAAELKSDCVSLWSGVVRDGASGESVWQRLVPGMGEVLEHAARRKVVVGFEPEPGMFIDTMARFRELAARCQAPGLRLTLDVGHVHCLDDGTLPDVIAEWADWLVNIHLEDMRRGTHEHLQFGDGDMDFPPLIEALKKVEYPGGVHVELSRHGHEAPTAARKAYEFLARLV